LAAAIDRRVVEELPGSTLAACGLIPPPVVGAVDRDPCPATPLDPDRTLLRGTAAIRIAEPRGAWTPAALALATDAIASLGGSFRAVSSIDPIADVVGGRADLALVRVAPRLPHPSGWLAPAAQLDRLFAREVPRETAGPLRGSASRWAALERRAVDRAVAIPLLSLQRDAFVGPSIDARTVLLHPVLGIDLAALDLS